MSDATCNVCHHGCKIPEGSYGFCGARRNVDGRVVCANYGKITSLALDPIEKKPISFFMPGKKVLSLGSFGCNLTCPYCQNHDISRGCEGDFKKLYDLTPQDVLEIAKREIPNGNIGVAYTYNEALVGYEFVRDTAKLISEAGLKNVLVTNGTATQEVLSQILPYIDAMNIDLKGFCPEVYKKLGGNFDMVKDFIEMAAKESHVELTSLIVPGFNDSLEDMEAQARWIASINPDIPLHITRYFPRYKYDKPATDIEVLRCLRDVAGRHLKRVLLGNV